MVTLNRYEALLPVPQDTIRQENAPLRIRCSVIPEKDGKEKL